ncbi:MAG TPA: mannose-1-phosphate guanylyltransferase/mannose-6-phosphate isomerase [Nitrospira sp.]|nr:mannose-1-phosphate guanylyltransferase/mannose-6-phosphate isomerase [Nitrospira sp.]MCW5795709.1 mannose-1-phosphate guanylyltransferase/mannose-6-phosphate isomerase [Nitrospira sp.]HMV57988.1 mannose-1-phosphate guanylyltransferase/mannose-6-phosphate isomerase [Nitrospira sp.]HMW86141.1 mannose-1-phosphate guanylyltransferase/mannose-6-phosphate isomerase [Nitrospira sp.]HMX89962.1 mannose-1-phosphate guanylyltransferase/mannose-6-phosphate isomerase [Nitrospira sp.]
MTNHLYPVILAGGSGTRFWPLSRHLYPKQLLRIIGDETLIQQTMRRVLSCASPDRVLISTNPGQADSIRVQLGEWKSDLKDNYVIEPIGRNTAPAIALVAAELLRRDPEAMMLVLPADHVVTGEKAFQAAVTLGMQLAEKGHLVTFGIKPTRPETGYGYIQPNRRTTLAKKDRLTGHPVARFVEKPSRTKAAQYLKSGNYFWNSGMFLWKAATIRDEINRHQPQLAKAVQKVHTLMTSGADPRQIEAAYKKVPSVSIDNGVMELSSHAAMIPVGFGWSDVGNWSSLEEVAPRDKAGNVVSGRVIDMDSSNSVLYADRRVVATIGLTDMVVVDTPDATLICPKSRSQDVKQMVEILKQQGAPEHLEHVTVFRPWGSYTVLEEGPGYKVKRVTVNPGGRLSLQLHHKRSEHWVVITGTARVTRGDDVLHLQIGQSTAIPVETPHRLENPGTETLHIIEVQNGPYLGEDDIVRFQDDYGRLGRAR